MGSESDVVMVAYKGRCHDQRHAAEEDDGVGLEAAEVEVLRLVAHLQDSHEAGENHLHPDGVGIRVRPLVQPHAPRRPQSRP